MDFQNNLVILPFIFTINKDNFRTLKVQDKINTILILKRGITILSKFIKLCNNENEK